MLRRTDPANAGKDQVRNLSEKGQLCGVEMEPIDIHQALPKQHGLSFLSSDYEGHTQESKNVIFCSKGNAFPILMIL